MDMVIENVDLRWKPGYYSNDDDDNTVWMDLWKKKNSEDGMIWIETREKSTHTQTKLQPLDWLCKTKNL